MNKRSLFTSSFKAKMSLVMKMLLVFFSVCLFCYCINVQYDEGYCASLSDKVERLRQIEGAKLVLIGDSNLSFGIDSKLLEESIQMPVVNMGLHAGLGNTFHENMAKLNVVSGDIYVYCPTSFEGGEGLKDAVLTWTALRNDMKLLRLVPKQDIWRVIKRYPTFLKRVITQLLDGNGKIKTGEIYARNNFNEYGDIAYKNPEYRYEFVEEIFPSEISDSTVQRINDLAVWLKERGATLVVAAYPIGKGELTADVTEFINFQEELETKLECEVISDYVDYMYDYDYFYDTSLHLTVEGTQLRTKQLIEDLKNSSICK